MASSFFFFFSFFSTGLSTSFHKVLKFLVQLSVFIILGNLQIAFRRIKNIPLNSALAFLLNVLVNREWSRHTERLESAFSFSFL